MRTPELARQRRVTAANLVKIRPLAALGVCVVCFGLSSRAQEPTLQVQIDASNAPRRLLRSRLELTVQPGRQTVVYPKWIPGEHGPNGPITDLVGLKFNAAGRTIAWERDPEDMFAFHVQVPPEATVLNAEFDLLLPAAAAGFASALSASAKLVVVNWNQVVLYPKGANVSDLICAPSLRLPEGWKFGSALPVVSEAAPIVRFSPVSLERLVDSPVLAAAHFRTLELTPGTTPAHFIHAAADSAAALEVKPETSHHFAHLVAETGALFGARHYGSYHFLLSLLYQARPEGAARRRSVDFYPEGGLIWLEADVLIRRESQGRRSIDDFCRNFMGGENTPPKVIPYTLEEVVATLDEVAAYSWREFFQARVYSISPGAPLGGIEGAGWKLAYTNSVPELLRLTESQFKLTDLQFSLGLIVREDGTLIDILPESPADRAGLAPNMKLLAVNSRRWTPELLRTAIRATAAGEPVELLVENADFFKTCWLDYYQGEKYPVVVRDESKPDLLAEILKPMVAAP